MKASTGVPTGGIMIVNGLSGRAEISSSLAPHIRPLCIFLLCICLNALAPGPAMAEDEIKPGETLDLDRCIAIALKKHPSILGAQGSLEASQSRVSQARSGYYPQLGLSGGYSRNHTEGASSSLGSGKYSYDEYSSSFNLSQNICDFGKTSASVDVNALSADASRFDLEDTSSQVIYSVKQAYFGVLQALQNRQAYQETMKQYELHLEQARRFYEVGIRPKIDVTKAEVDLSQARLNLLKADNGMRVARITLNNTMGMPEAPEYSLKEDTAVREYPIDLESALKRGYEYRPDLASARYKREAALRSVDLARSGYYPELSGSAGYGWTGQDFPLNDRWTVGASVNVPIFSGFLTRSQVSEAKANLMSAQANEESVRQSIRSDIEQSYTNLIQAREGIDLADLAVKQAKENRELAQGRYAAGVGNAIEVTDALVSEISARTSYDNALYAYRLAIAQLERSMGVSR